MFSEREMVSASELREFIYCQRAWSLTQQGYAISLEAKARRDAGVEFHVQRAADAVQGDKPNAIWILSLVMAAILLLAIYAIRAKGG